MPESDSSRQRFVLLEHTTNAGVHWDLLIERAGEERLASWRLLADPTRGAFPIAAEPMAAHRKLYLDYEGPISGERGSVRRLDRGEAELNQRDDGCATGRLGGALLSGSYTIVATPEGGFAFALDGSRRNF